MDGSLQKINTMNPDGSSGLEIMRNQPVFKNNESKSVNPIKDGLSDTTLNILKACLKSLKERHEIDIKVSK